MPVTEGQFDDTIIGPKLPPAQRPSLGRVVLYTISQYDADKYYREHNDVFGDVMPHQHGREWHSNDPRAGAVLPMTITDVDERDTCQWISGNVQLNNGHLLWVGSKSESAEPGVPDHWCWPPRV